MGLLALATALLVPLVAASPAGSAAEKDCKEGQGTHQEVELGIVKAVGCFTQPTTGVFKAPGGQDVDLNGFIVTVPAAAPAKGDVPAVKGDGLTINKSTREVTTGDDKIQLSSKGFPKGPNDLQQLGEPFKLRFRAPDKGPLVIEDIRLGSSNAFVRALAGFSPIGNMDTPIKLEEDGKGSMDLTLALTGYFTLKDRDQSATVRLPTQSGKGTVFDGFEIKLREIDSFKVFKVLDFEASFSAAKKELTGSATVTFPFSKDRETGFGGGFKIEDAKFDEIDANAHGLKIPIFAGGTLTDIAGKIQLKNTEKEAIVSLAAQVSAEFGPQIPIPNVGKVAPVRATAGAKISSGYGGFFALNGGIDLFRVPFADAQINIFFKGVLGFGVGFGVGFPAFKNKPDEPFYIGARIDGWFGQGKYQFTGDGRFNLFGVTLLEGRALISYKANAACWTVLGVPGGAVFTYSGQRVETFGVGCGLDDYKEPQPGPAIPSAAQGARSIRLDRRQVILEVKGAGGAPRFTAKSSNGSVFNSPAAGKDGKRARDHAFFHNKFTNETHLILPHPKGRWTITPHRGSARITSVKAGRRAPKERVKAEVRGSGKIRTLVWRSRNRANTRLTFTERLPGGSEKPIVVETDAPSGRKRFRVHQGSHYGKRRLHVLVHHGYGSRQAARVDRYRVRPPRRLKPPRLVRARRYIHDVHVRWSGVKRASGYLVVVESKGKRGKRTLRHVRRMSPRRRNTIFRSVGGTGRRMVAKVHTLNSDDELGRHRRDDFKVGNVADSLSEAARLSVRSTDRGKGSVRVLTHCPEGGHCQVAVALRRRGRRISRVIRFQQTPDTFQLVHLKPRSRRVRRLLRRGRDPRLQVSVTLDRTTEKVTARAKAKL